MTNKDIVCTTPSVPVAVANMLRPEHSLDARKVADRLLTSGAVQNCGYTMRSRGVTMNPLSKIAV